MIRFLLNETLVELEDIPSDTTVLDYLRGNSAYNPDRKTGTKEGCCSGDCGACTVVLAEPENDRLNYQTVNTCIALLPSLNGKQLITVEDLAAGEKLHPVQQAMVDHHGSQCGFCTPGIIMSLFAFHHEPSDQRPDVLEALGGNLCRCTGYQPIVDAAREIAEMPNTDAFSQQEQTTLQKLEQLREQQDDKAQGVYMPTSEKDLADYLLKSPNARLLAGGTDLGLEVTQQLKEIPDLVTLASVEELKELSCTENEIVIGSAVTYRQIEPLLSQYFPEFSEMLARLGSQQIRNVGTLGGNIGNASPIGDTPPVLLALDASIELRKGDRIRTLPLEQFFLGYKKTVLEESEFIARIRIPLTKHNLKVYKLSKRYGDDISTVLAAINLELNDRGEITRARVALGGMAEIPKRATACEQALIGQKADTATLEIAQQAIRSEFKPLSDVRASSDYRLQAACNLLERYFLELSGQKARIIAHA
ncbi:xanthine dehydrogenase small subunit [Endozoicomonas arenosclerae]|uniref:xanthine dehydrogenase small subunit n=1 Tax=Endozoicomonas arenosclerae TaxID=1633495 RepID=UPI0007808883|nr:xanthine dehydrogenase small subunit [Endozoicomonas arenosclerae]